MASDFEHVCCAVEKHVMICLAIELCMTGEVLRFQPSFRSMLANKLMPGWIHDMWWANHMEGIMHDLYFGEVEPNV